MNSKPNAGQNEPEIENLIHIGKIKRASELVEQGEFDEAARTLPTVNTFEVMRLRLLIENHVKSEQELEQQREVPLTESATYVNLLSLCNDEERAAFERINVACTENKELREQLERGYDLLAYSYFTEATTFAENLTQYYADRAEVWNLIILAKSELRPARDFDAPVQKRNASLEKFSEYKEMVGCKDFSYFSTKPDFAARYLKTKTDIFQEKQEQIVRERTKLAIGFSHLTLGLGILSLCILFPFFLIFNSVTGIVIGVLGAAVAVGSFICNVRVSVLDPKRPLKESTLAYVLILLLIAVYVIFIAVAIPMIPAA